MAIAIVLACILIWFAVLNFFESRSEANTSATSTAEEQGEIQQTQTEGFQLPPSPTLRPNCETFVVNVSSAFLRECPALFCDTIIRYGEGKEVCVYGRANDDRYDGSQDWYIIDQNPQGAFPDLAYMHSSVLEPANPTHIPTRTFT
ncbi:MAG TPA: hypothetical protein VJZ27_15510, partial [Aggregatilineales bacterium]|nr:hypothetical protein [Aggregatilineales bacterium]